MRVVIDTNIIVSAYLGGALETIIVAWRAGKFTLLVSNEIADEYHQVLRRPKFRIAYSDLDNFFAFLLDQAEFVVSSETVNIVTADATDNKFLEAALAGKADLIVSGDNHLLQLKEFRNIPIISAQEFITRLSL
ncbi:MAG TPA: putative toxin-antitoxin system toxin component, PIN family [Anaerolineales bacterium]|nr:putative toxin-antitoxin system toxin component, PIN family [Anaerolineales bacterium]